MILIINKHNRKVGTWSRVAQRKRAGPITQRSMDRNHPLLGSSYAPFPLAKFYSSGYEPKNVNQFLDLSYPPLSWIPVPAFSEIMLSLSLQISQACTYLARRIVKSLPSGVLNKRAAGDTPSVEVVLHTAPDCLEKEVTNSVFISVNIFQ